MVTSSAGGGNIGALALPGHQSPHVAFDLELDLAERTPRVADPKAVRVMAEAKIHAMLTGAGRGTNSAIMT